MEADLLETLPSGVKLLLRSLHNLIQEKLNDHNYFSWSNSVKTMLFANLLLSWVDGTGVVPPINVTVTDKDRKASTETNPAHMSWALVDSQVHACVLAVISPQIQKYARGFTTSMLFGMLLLPASTPYKRPMFSSCVTVFIHSARALAPWSNI